MLRTVHHESLSYLGLSAHTFFSFFLFLLPSHLSTKIIRCSDYLKMLIAGRLAQGLLESIRLLIKILDHMNILFLCASCTSDLLIHW